MDIFFRQEAVYILLISVFVCIFIDYGSILLIRFIRKFKWKLIKLVKKGVFK